MATESWSTSPATASSGTVMSGTAGRPASASRSWTGRPREISNFSMYGNVIERSGRAYFDTWFDGASYTVRNLRIYNNTGYGIGEGLYTVQRGVTRTHSGTVIDDQPVVQTGCVLKNNIFCGPASLQALQVQSHDVLSGWEIDNNCYFGGSVFNVDWANISFSLWRSTYNNDGASLYRVVLSSPIPRMGTSPSVPAPPAYKTGRSSLTPGRPARQTWGPTDRQPPAYLDPTHRASDCATFQGIASKPGEL